MNVFFTTLFLIALSIPSLGQHAFGPKVNIGVSTMVIKNLEVPQSNTFYPKLSGQVGLFYNFTHNRILIGADLVFMPISGKKYAKAPLYDQTGIYGYDETSTKMFINYLALPIYAGLSVNKFTINIGIHPSLVLKSGTKLNHITKPTNSDTDYHAMKINNLQWGFKVGLRYKLNHKVIVETNYYVGPFNSYESSFTKSVTSWQIHQVTMGINFNFLKKDHS